MKLSSLQLREYFFNKLEISERRGTDDQPSVGRSRERPFDFNGVTITTDIEIGRLAGQDNDPHNYAIKLGVRIENNKGKPAPYNISVETTGFFAINSDVPAESREGFVLVNGCSMLYGAIREMVLTVTSRFVPGGLVLPTVNFHAVLNKDKVEKPRAQDRTPTENSQEPKQERKKRLK